MTTDRVAVVTGGCRGIGQAIAQRLASGGATVVVWDLPSVIAEHTVMAGEHGRGRIELMTVDVGDEAAVDLAVQEIVATTGRLDILVNNAAISPKVAGARVPPHRSTTQEWDDVLRVNLSGPFFACRAVIPHMRDGGFGRIVNVSSKAGRSGARLAGLAYGVTKAGINGMTRTLAYDVAPDGITVNSIAPGRIRTPMAAQVSDEVNSRLVAATPVGRIGETTEIAELVAYLVSEEAGFVTGVTVDINGGSYMAP